MGKISLYDAISSVTILTETNLTEETLTGYTLTDSTLSGASNVYSFIDNNGNVTQIKKVKKDRFKFYIDPEIVFITTIDDCVIGVSGNPEDPNCIFGIALGVGDNDIVLAKYI